MMIVAILPSWECGVAVTVEHRSYWSAVWKVAALPSLVRTSSAGGSCHCIMVAGKCKNIRRSDSLQPGTKHWTKLNKNKWNCAREDLGKWRALFFWLDLVFKNQKWDFPQNENLMILKVWENLLFGELAELDPRLEWSCKGGRCLMVGRPTPTCGLQHKILIHRIQIQRQRQRQMQRQKQRQRQIQMLSDSWPNIDFKFYTHV